jgi:lipopolysaccharide transport system permease protein
MSTEVAASEPEPIAPPSPAVDDAGTPPTASHAVPMLVIEPPRGWVSLNLKEVWRYRDLMRMLIWRDISSKYRQSVIGYGWVFIKPLVSVAIFVVVFGRLAKLGSDGAPSPLFYMAALIPWNYFASALSGVSSSILGGSGLLTKVYFPRLILPLSSLGVGLADLALQFVLLAGMMIWFGYFPGWPILLLPCFLLLTVATSLAFGLWLTALNVRYRDVGHAVPFLVQAWFYLSPVVYSSSLVPPKWHWLYGLNPWSESLTASAGASWEPQHLMQLCWVCR